MSASRLLLLGVIGVGGLTIGVLRLTTGSESHLIPNSAAWALVVIFGVSLAVALASTGWNLLVGNRWNDDNFIDKLGDLLLYFWP
jgi:hypothetical protein